MFLRLLWVAPPENRQRLLKRLIFYHLALHAFSRPTRESPEITETEENPPDGWDTWGRPTRESPEITETYFQQGVPHLSYPVAPPENRQRLLKQWAIRYLTVHMIGRPTRESPEITETC